MSQTRGMAYLRRKLELKRSRVLTRYKYFQCAMSSLEVNSVPALGSL